MSRYVGILAGPMGLTMGASLWLAPILALAQPSDTAPLQLEAKIPLGSVRGRIDHLAIDLDRRRLFVAELGNDSVGVVDLDARKVVQQLGGLKEPQGVGYLSESDTLFVANAGDGSMRLFQGPDYAPSGRIDLGDDADNIRVDQGAKRVIVGYGSGALAVIEAGKRIGDIRLSAHPESFQLDPRSQRIYVNLPNRRAVAVVDQAAGKVSATWPMTVAGANFPMALDDETHHVLVMFRNPAKLGVFAMEDGGSVAAVDACGDADDLFVDAKRHHLCELWRGRHRRV